MIQAIFQKPDLVIPMSMRAKNCRFARFRTTS